MLERNGMTQESGTWCGLNRPELSVQEADAAVFGIPHDEREGARFAGCAPDAVRRAAIGTAACTERLESMEELKIVDVGNFVNQEKEVLFSEVKEFVCDLVRKEIFFTVIGGDHSITIPVEAGIDNAVTESFGIIHFDAHFDLCDRQQGELFSRGTVQRRALDLSNIDGVQNIYFVGVRSIEPEEQLLKKRHSMRVRTAYDCHRFGDERVAEEVIERMARFSSVYITIDLNCLDQAYVSGAEDPQFGGLTSRQLLEILRMLFERLPIIGFDVTGIASGAHCGQNSVFAAKTIVMECWGNLARKKGKLK